MTICRPSSMRRLSFELTHVLWPTLPSSTLGLIDYFASIHFSLSRIHLLKPALGDNLSLHFALDRDKKTCSFPSKGWKGQSLPALFINSVNFSAVAKVVVSSTVPWKITHGGWPEVVEGAGDSSLGGITTGSFIFHDSIDLTPLSMEAKTIGEVKEDHRVCYWRHLSTGSFMVPKQAARVPQLNNH